MVVSELRPLVVDVPKRAAGLATAAALGAGAGLAWCLGLIVLGDRSGMVKVPLVLVGMVAAYQCLRTAGRTIWGADFDTGFWLSAAWLIMLVVAAALADVLPLANHNNPSLTLNVAGNLRPDLFSAHPLGTNNFGLDLLARSIFAARASLLTALLAVGVAIVVGGTIGLIAGYYRGWLDTVVSILTDTWLAFPALVVLLSVAAIVGVPTTVPQAVVREGIALSLVGLSTMVRVARANTFTFAQREFVTASRALGATDRRVLLTDLAPNVLMPLLSYSFTLLAVFIVADGSLAYLGLGLQQPEPSWGNMIAEGSIDDLRAHPHIPLVPGVVMFLTVFAFSRVGDRLRVGQGAETTPV